MFVNISIVIAFTIGGINFIFIGNKIMMAFYLLMQAYNVCHLTWQWQVWHVTSILFTVKNKIF